MKFKFDENGLIPAVVQDVDSGEVLMVAYMNEESLGLTLEKQETVFYSRSRNKLWHKGESSGHTQKIKQILTDCDQDCLVIKVTQEGGACHKGYRSCFVNSIDEKGALKEVIQEPLFDPNKVYEK